MSLIEEDKKDEQENAQKKLFIIVGIASVVLIAALGIWWLRSGGGKNSNLASQVNLSQKLEGEGVIREGTPEFENYKEKIIMDAPKAVEAERVIGDTVMTLEATVRNFSGRTLNGLEVYGSVVDTKGNPVKERTVIIIPTQRAELDNNKNMPTRVYFEGFKITDDRANIKMRVTAFRFAPQE